MSIGCMNDAWRSSVTDRTQLLVLMSLADQANEHGLCWPSVDYVGGRARCKVRSVQRALNALQKDGHLSIQRGQGRNHTNVYHVHPRASTPEQLDAPERELFLWEKKKKQGQNDGKPQAGAAVKGVKSCIKGVTGDAPGKATPATGDVKGVTGDVKGVTSDTLIPMNHQESPSCAKEARERDFRDLAFESLSRAQGTDPAKMTKGERRAVGVALASIREAEPEVSAAMVAEKAAVYRKRWPDVACTAHALAKHWGGLEAEEIEEALPESQPVPLETETPEPDGWREAWKFLYPDHPLPRCWSEIPLALIAGVLGQIRTAANLAKKNKGGGGAE
jgi:hypothetical protein